MIASPYLLFLGDAHDALAAKVAQGIRDWRPDAAIGQYRMQGCNADLGLPDMTIAQAAAAGARTLVVGVANRGGVISPAWLGVLTEALAAGLDLASGLHNLLRDEPELIAAAMAHHRQLHDVRVPPHRYPIANGKRRSGRRCLAVGTDCSVGKMYTALAMEREMHARGRSRQLPRHRPDRHPDHRRRRPARRRGRRLHGRLRSRSSPRRTTPTTGI